MHGFRSSFRTWAAERTSYTRDVCEMALAHKVGDAVERSYARSVLFDQRRGLMDAWADVAAQEERDAHRPGRYQRLVDAGVLEVDHGKRVVAVEKLIDRVLRFRPQAIVCDRFRVDEVRDAVRGRCPVQPRITRWSESTFDVQATRKQGHDGALAVVEAARPLFRLTLAETLVDSDDDGNVRTVKARDKRSRDDLGRALTLACGAVARLPAPKRPRVHMVHPA